MAATWNSKRCRVVGRYPSGRLAIRVRGFRGVIAVDFDSVEFMTEHDAMMAAGLDQN